MLFLQAWMLLYRRAPGRCCSHRGRTIQPAPPGLPNGGPSWRTSWPVNRDAIVIEDDQFAGVAYSRPGSLLNDARLDSRVIYIRSFSKSIDLLLAVAVARPPLRELLVEAKGFVDGWTSRLLQRLLAGMLADDALYAALDTARKRK